MDAKTFINTKHEAALEELRAIEAEYIPRRNAALAEMAMAQQWLDELASEKGKAEPVAAQPEVAPPAIQPQVPKLVVENGNAEPEGILREVAKTPSENWVSARDLLPRIRQAS